MVDEVPELAARVPDVRALRDRDDAADVAAMYGVREEVMRDLIDVFPRLNQAVFEAILPALDESAFTFQRGPLTADGGVCS